MEAVGEPDSVGEGEGGVADGEVKGGVGGEGEEAQSEGVIGALESGVALEDDGAG